MPGPLRSHTIPSIKHLTLITRIIVQKNLKKKSYTPPPRKGTSSDRKQTLRGRKLTYF